MTETVVENEQLRAVLDDSAIVTMTDEQGRINYVNDKFVELSGYGRDELIGGNHRIVNSGFHPRSFWSGMYRTLRSVGVWQAEVKNRAKDGSDYWVLSTMRAFRDSDGKIRKFISVRQDVTPLKLAQLELSCTRDAAVTANRVKSEFLSAMSHEIRHPMTAILGYTDVLKDQLGSAPTEGSVQEALDAIDRNSRHLLALINDILDLSKIEAGKMTLEKLPCSLADIVTDVVIGVRSGSLKTGVAVKAELDDHLPVRIKTDPTRLRQILVNLMSNAVKFTSQGSVTLCVRAVADPDPRLVLDVKDPGIGVTPEQAVRLFMPFAQADASTARQYGGTGLGLAISRALASALGGTLELIASQTGIGSHFRAVLPFESVLPETVDSTPAAPLKGHQPSASISGRIESPSLAGVRLLLVEDGADNQKLLSLFLRKAGAAVRIAANGLLAVEAVCKVQEAGEAFDLILMDMQMPVMDGYEATSRLRALQCKTPIVALTAHALSGERARCIQAGCDDYLTKPISRVALVQAVHERLALVQGASAPAGTALG